MRLNCVMSNRLCFALVPANAVYLEELRTCSCLQHLLLQQLLFLTIICCRL